MTDAIAERFIRHVQAGNAAIEQELQRLERERHGPEGARRLAGPRLP